MTTASGHNHYKMSDFDILRVIGKGYMGKVMVVREKQSNEIYAIKSIHKRAILERKEINHTRTERDILANLTDDHHTCPFLVHLHAAFQDANNVYFLMDFHGGGDLASLLTNFVRLPETWARFYVAELVLALEALHKRGIVYRDLKPENVLLARTGHLVLVDFGLCKHLMDRGSATMTFCGTPEYLAPEVLLRQPYGFAVDWWNLGILLYEMLFGITPFWNDNPAQLYRKIVNDPLIIPKGGISIAARDLLFRLLAKNPLERPIESTIKQHPFFAEIHWSDVKNLYYRPPYVPFQSGRQDDDVTAFDPMFTTMTPALTPQDPADSSLAERAFQGFTFRPTTRDNREWH